ncbi:hypothetical protein [Nonomuraea sp. NPDC049400]|uniref:hypothetical protein n=1 Tax=Nonomuraea sp. NPDC049400 TaxID=3364352 RepID=UPI00378D79F3
MARIRSIKPDFFTSEKIASLPLSARLLFIGLWTHVDDNGVTPDNEKLINAAIWPLEEDPLESLRRTREDLARLSTAGLIVRYQAGGKALLFVLNWDEHQKVSHPAKPRYTRPTPEQIRASFDVLTSNNDEIPESHAEGSGASPEDGQKALAIFGPEQGAGSREQGVPPSAGAAPPHPDPGKPINAGDVVGAYVDGAREGRQPHPAETLRKRIGKQAGQLLKEKVPADVLLTAARNAGACGWQDLAVQIQRDAAAAKDRDATNGKYAPGSDPHLKPSTAPIDPKKVI